jgi:predicted nucleic acid-binding protein
MSGIVFDTTVIIKYLEKDPLIPDLKTLLPEKDRFVSIITSAEETSIRNFLSDIIVVPITDNVEREAIAIRRNTKMKLPDAIIAATAIALDAEVLSVDPHFTNCIYAKLRVMPISS